MEVLERAGITAVHWSEIGSGSACNIEICQYARSERCVVVTQDLDFSQMLLEYAKSGQSVALLRLHNELEPIEQQRVIGILQKCHSELEVGALLVIDGTRARIRPLPMR